jgi:hypothetical protein
MVSMSGSNAGNGFFALGSTQARRLMHARPVDEVQSPERVLRGQDAVSSPLRFEVVSGGEQSDFVSCSLVALRPISTRFVEAIERAQLSGWFTYPVVLEHKGIPLRGYFGLGVNGMCGPIDPAKARIVEMPPKAPGGVPLFAATGIVLDRATWDGSDFFVPQNTSVICLTPRAADALKQLSGVRLTPLEEYVLAIYSSDPRIGRSTE